MFDLNTKTVSFSRLQFLVENSGSFLFEKRQTQFLEKICWTNEQIDWNSFSSLIELVERKWILILKI